MTNKEKETTLHWKKLTIDFSKYTIVGFLITIANVFLMWLFIDILKIYTLLASSVVVVGLHIVKFIAYKKVRLIRKQFIKYTTIQSGSGMLNIIGVWFLIDILHQPTVFSSMFVVFVLFILRFVFFKITKLTLD
jgi:putative flippase GtrA